MSSKTSKKLDFFRKGVAALERLNAKPEGTYACPICQNAFTAGALDNGQLTLEHVPPKSVGGQEIMLTCSKCNKKAGHAVDSHVKRREDIRDFSRRQLERPLRAQIKFPGMENPANVKVSGAGGYFITGLPDNNNPEDQKKFEEVLERLSAKGGWDGVKFEITLQQAVDMRKARVGDLRTAYLVAFAVFGYRFALSPALDSVRKQLMNVEKKLLENFHWALYDREAEGRHMFIMDEPVVSVCVQLDRTVVFLPGRSSDEYFYSELPEKMTGSGNVTLRKVRWPTEMRLALDFM